MNRASIVIPLVLLVNASWAIGQVFWKRAMSAVAGSGGLVPLALGLLREPNFYVGGAFSVVCMLSWLLVLSKADLSYATPIAGMGIVFVAVFSAVFLHEPVGVQRIVGTIAIAIGVGLVARS